MRLKKEKFLALDTKQKKKYYLKKHQANNQLNCQRKLEARGMVIILKYQVEEDTYNIRVEIPVAKGRTAKENS